MRGSVRGSGWGRHLKSTPVQFLTGWIHLGWHRPGVFLGVAAILAVALAVWAPLRLVVDSTLRRMAPRSSDALEQLRIVEARSGPLEQLVLAFQDPSLERVVSFQDGLAGALARFDQLAWVDSRTEESFLVALGPALTSVADLCRMEDRFPGLHGGDATCGFEESHDTTGLPPAAVEYWVGIWKEWIRSGTAPRLAATEGLAPESPDSLWDRRIAWDASRAVWVGAVAAGPRVSIEQGDSVLKLVERVERSMDSLAAGERSIERGVFGPYAMVAQEVRVAREELAWGTVLVALLLLVALRGCTGRWTHAMLLLVPPALAGVVGLMAMTLLCDPVDLPAVLVLGVSAGLGVEISLHLRLAFLQARRLGIEGPSAVLEGYRRTGPAVVLSVLLGIAGFLALAFASIPSVREAGLFLAVGLSLNAALAFALLPSILSISNEPRVALDEEGRQVHRRSLPRWHPAEHPWAAAITAGGVLLASIPASRLTLATDLSRYRVQGSVFEDLKDRARALLPSEGPDARGRTAGIGYGAAMGRIGSLPTILRTSGSPMHFSAPRMARPAPGYHGDLSGPILHPTDSVRNARLDVLESWTGASGSSTAETLAERARHGRDAPPRLGRLLGDPLEDHGAKLVIQEFPSSQAGQVLDIRDRLRDGIGPSTREWVVSPWFVHAETLEALPREMAKVAGACAVLVGLVLLLGGVASRTLFLGSMVFLFAIVVVLAAGMTWLDAPLDAYGILVIPSLVAASIDASVHVGHETLRSGVSREGRGRLHERLSAVSWGILLNASGFAWLPLSSHPGMQRLGFLALGGALVSWGLVWSLLPWVHRLGAGQPLSPWTERAT